MILSFPRHFLFLLFFFSIYLPTYKLWSRVPKMKLCLFVCYLGVETLILGVFERFGVGTVS